MLSKDKYFGMASALTSGPIRKGSTRMLNVSNYNVSGTGPLVTSDDFTAPNGARLSARGWTEALGQWAVQGNKAQKTVAGTGQDYAYRAGAANGVLTCTVVTGSDDTGLVFNASGSGYWLAQMDGNIVTLYSTDGTTFTSVASAFHFQGTVGFTAEVIVNGDNVKVKINGTQYIDYTTSGRAYKTQTGVGIRQYSTVTGTSTFDNFTFSGLPGILLPSRTDLNTGGPYFFLVNTGANTPILYQDTGAVLKTLPPNTVTTVVLGTSQWWAFQDALDTAKSIATNGGIVRTVPVGYVVPPATNTVPTSYDSFLCTGGWRRARLCGTGAYANVWMLDTDVDPHFVAGIAAFKYQSTCFYFKQSDKLEASHGFSLSAGDVTWYPDCPTCTSGGGGDGTDTGPCADGDPSLPGAILVKLTSTDPASLFNGTKTFTRVGTSALYTSGELFVPAGCCTAKVSIACASGVWGAGINYSCLACPGGSGISYSDTRSGGASKLPYIGNYPVTGYTVGSSGPDYHTTTVEVLGYLG